MTKTCPHCGEEKDIESGFYKRRARQGGALIASGWCKVCTTNYGKARQKAARAALRILEAEGRA